MNKLERKTLGPRKHASWRAFLIYVAVTWCLSLVGGAQAAPLGAPALLVFELARELRHDAAAVSLTNELRQRVNDSTEFALMSDNPSLVSTARAAGCEIKSMRPFSLNDTSDQDIDRACQERLAKRLNVERYLWGYLFEKQGQLYVKLHLWQQGQADRIHVLPYREGARTSVADRLYRHLVQAGRVGDLRVSGGALPEGGELYVEGAPKPVARWEGAGVDLTLPLGPVALEVRAAGKVLARARGQVVAGSSREVRLEKVVEAPATSTPLSTPPLAASEHATWVAPVGWTVLGVGAAAIGFGVFSNARVASLDDDLNSDPALVAYRQGLARGQDGCDAAEQNLSSGQVGAASASTVRDHCGSLDTWKGVRAASYIGGGVLAAGGAAFLLFSLSPSNETAARRDVPRWLATPALGPGFAGAALKATW
jgi:hypothetical protein